MIPDDGRRAAAVLEVEASVLGKRWRPRCSDERAAISLAQRYGLPEVVGRVLQARGVPSDEVERFLNPRLKTALPDPLGLKDMERAAARLADAVVNGEAVAVFGDYDVDGATSSALLSRYFKSIGSKIAVYIPDRLTEGYGPNIPALKRLRSEGTAIVVTVDCGISAHEALSAAASDGLDVIVVDHHAAEPKLPPAVAVVNPNRLDETEGLGQLAAVGVTFLLVIALNRRLRALGWFDGRDEPDLMQWLDLVALGTVCDVVPLTGVNRALVTQGLKIMARRRNAGLTALADVAGVREPPGTFHAGFLIGPRVNAGGRVGEAGLGARLLASDDPAEAARIAGTLDRYNGERQAIEAQVLNEAKAAVEASGLRDGHPVVIAGEGWHPGVIGIVASRLAERYLRPAIVIGLSEDTGKGSGRSVQGVDLGSAVIAARQSGLLVNGGGHRMAAGLTVERGKLEDLKAFLVDRISGDMARSGGRPELGVDGSLSLGAATEELLASLTSLAPFGMGHAEPRFAFPSVRIAKADVVGKGHVRCFLADEAGRRLKGIAFRSIESGLGDVLLNARGGALHLVGHLRTNVWRGQSETQLVIEDAARP